jgi:hypothetical protein
MRSDTRRPAQNLARSSRALVAAAVALAAAVVGSAASARLSDPPPPETEAMVQEQIDAMIDGGIPEDHPKVASLREDLAAMERSDPGEMPAEPGIDLGAVVESARRNVEAGRRAPGRSPDRVDAAGTAVWDSGEVVCEPVPGLLGVEDVADAVCASVPQPDGTSRYVAIGPDRVAHVVAFGVDGDVGRLADRPVSAPVVPGETRVVPTPHGDLEITPPGRPPVVAELP